MNVCGELLCVGSLDQILGRADVYQVIVQGGREEQLQQWLLGLHWRDNCWHGQLQGEPDAFLAETKEILPQILFALEGFLKILAVGGINSQQKRPEQR